MLLNTHSKSEGKVKDAVDLQYLTLGKHLCEQVKLPFYLADVKMFAKTHRVKFSQ